MKFSDFDSTEEMLAHYKLKVQNSKFIEFDQIQSLTVSPLVLADFDFILANRGKMDMEAYACEFLISPLLKEAWKLNPKLKLFSHIQIKYEDMVLIPDYVITPKDKIGLNLFKTPLLITVEAKNDDYELGWSDAYKQLVVAHALNKNDKIPIYAIVSIGKGWEFGKLDKKIIYKHPISLGLDNPNRLLGVLDFIFADCVKTAEKFDLF
ncbi:MAG: hypothetical protein EAZ97_14260 [Bacteroidetes bacterium]|nr:MAG: hypothetical protein EAZ97_14260 [Bacteroidota bacterium]